MIRIPPLFQARGLPRVIAGAGLAAVLLLCGRCATARSNQPELRAELVDSRVARTLSGEQRYYLTLAYRDQEGASCTTTVEVDQRTYLRMRSYDEPCIHPRGDHWLIAACHD